MNYAGKALKILGLLALALILIVGGLTISGRILTSRLETESDPHALAPWGPGTSFLPGVEAGSLTPSPIIEPEYADYAAGRDVVMEWINQQEQP